MRCHYLLGLMASLTIANPVPQDFDWDAITDAQAEAADAPTPDDIPVVVDEAAAAQTIIPYQPSAVASSVAAAVSADPTDTTPLRLAKRDCAAGPNDNPDSFANDPTWPNAANNAQTPPGYRQAFVNQVGSSDGVYGYSGYSLLDTYDTATCAARCDAIGGCYSFNIYYERDASQQPTNECPNPSSQVLIKCVYWGGPVTQNSATNVGQYQNQFQVLIGGSNGYVNTTIATPAGFNAPIALGNAAINAPLDCNNADPYMGVKIFTKGRFDTNLCATACTATSNYNLAHSPKNGKPQTCQFFNTYILYNETTAVGQYCAMYNETWPSSFATNTGQWRGKFHFNIGSSFAYSNTTADADKPVGCTNRASP